MERCDDCDREAIWSIGHRKNWHLCDVCAGSKRFNRYKYRVLLRENRRSEAEGQDQSVSEGT